MVNLENLIEEDELFNGSEDERYLNSLTEADRERVLYERHLQIKKLREREELENRISNRMSEGNVKIENVKKNTLSFEEFQSILLKRDNISPHVYRSDIDVIIGNYVCIRLDKGVIVGKILSLEAGKEVYLLPVQDRTNKTNIIISVKSNQKEYKNLQLIYVSNTKVDEETYNKLLEMGLIPTKSQLNKYKDTMKKLNKQLTDKEITEAVNRKKSFYPPKINRAKQKIQLIQQKDRALEIKHFDEAKKLQEMIDKMNEEEAKNEKKDIWATISERNMKKNKEMGYRAQKVTEKYDPKADALNPFKRKKHRSYNYSG